VVGLFPTASYAGDDSGYRDRDVFLYVIRGQGQLVLLTSLYGFDDFGSVEAQLNVSMVSVGAAVGFGYNRVNVPTETSDRYYHGGFSHLAIQWRPLQLISPRIAYRYVDVHGDLGFIVGGLRRSGSSRLRGAIYGGVGLDGAIPLMKRKIKRTRSELRKGMPNIGYFMLVITAQYRYMLKQVPKDADRHELVLGIGVRSVM
jgi:hypothetical protein